MHVVALNGSPRKEGNTHLLIQQVCAQLERQGITTEEIFIGDRVLQGCTHCGACWESGNERCILNDEVNDWYAALCAADGVILGSPVHAACMTAPMKAFVERAVCLAQGNMHCGGDGSLFRKVGVPVVAMRRAGGAQVYHQLMSFFLYTKMIMPCSRYWPFAYGNNPGDVLNDAEGLTIMKTLGENMGWLIRKLAH